MSLPESSDAPLTTMLQVILGTAAGVLHLLSDQGATIGEFTIWSDQPIDKLSWSSPKSSGAPERTEREIVQNFSRFAFSESTDKSRICTCFRGGTVYLLESTDDADPVVCQTGLSGVLPTFIIFFKPKQLFAVVAAQWTRSGEFLAVVGFKAEAERERNPARANARPSGDAPLKK